MIFGHEIRQLLSGATAATSPPSIVQASFEKNCREDTPEVHPRFFRFPLHPRTGSSHERSYFTAVPKHDTRSTKQRRGTSPSPPKREIYLTTDTPVPRPPHHPPNHHPRPIPRLHLPHPKTPPLFLLRRHNLPLPVPNPHPRYQRPLQHQPHKIPPQRYKTHHEIKTRGKNKIRDGSGARRFRGVLHEVWRDM